MPALLGVMVAGFRGSLSGRFPIDASELAGREPELCGEFDDGVPGFDALDYVGQLVAGEASDVDRSRQTASHMGATGAVVEAFEGSSG